MDNRFYMVKDLQKMGLGRDKAYGLMHNKAFPSIKIGGRFYVSHDSLMQWLKKYEYKEIVL